MPAALRVNRGTPRWASSWAMLRLAEGWVRLNSRAAALQLPDRATDSKIRRLRSEGTSLASATIRLAYSPFPAKDSCRSHSKNDAVGLPSHPIRWAYGLSRNCDRAFSAPVAIMARVKHCVRWCSEGRTGAGNDHQTACGDRHIGHGGHRGSLATGREPARPHALAGRGRHVGRDGRHHHRRRRPRARPDAQARGRIKVASQTSSTADTVDPAKQNNQTDYSRCFTFYNGADPTRRQPGAAARARRSRSRATAAPRSGRSSSARTCKLPRRHAAHRRRRRLLAGAPQGSGDRLEGQGARRARWRRSRRRGRTRCRSRSSPQRRPAGRARHVSHFLIIKNGTTDLHDCERHRPLSSARSSSPASGRSACATTSTCKPGKPYLDEIEFFGIPDETARVNALLSGDVQHRRRAQPAARPGRCRRARATPCSRPRPAHYNDLVMRLDSDAGQQPGFRAGA